jgi:hypothetical protein
MEWKKVTKELPKHAEEFMFSVREPSASKSQAIPGTAKLPIREVGFPSVLKKLFGTLSKSLHFLEEESIWPLLLTSAELDFESFEKATKLDIKEIPVLIEQEHVNQLVRDTKLSVLQILYDPSEGDKPELLGAKAITPTGEKADVIIFTQLPNDKIGFISRSPTDLFPIPFNSLPANLKVFLLKSPTIKLEGTPVSEVPKAPEVAEVPEVAPPTRDILIKEEKEKQIKKEIERLGRPLVLQEKLDILRRVKAMFPEE